MAFSFFFRDLPILEAAAELFIHKSQGKRNLKVWVAGSAMGQEVYTLAIVLAERLGYFAFNNLQITATDIEKEFGDIITGGIYPGRDLERIPAELKKKYFEEKENDQFRINPRLTDRIRFIHHDLLTFTNPGDNYGLIVCKNVLLHFKPEERMKVYQAFFDCLDHEGVLANENTQKLPVELNDCFKQVSPEFQIYTKVSRS
ncbi:MAG: CheR family methyltransferase [Candidatus Riflebacteria bacterium]